MTKATDTKGWKIDVKQFKQYKSEGWVEDYFEETPDFRYGVYIYNITEWRMMSYCGTLALYNNKDQSSLILNSSKTDIWFDNSRTFDYAPQSDCLIFRRSAYRENSSKPSFPFILIKPTEKKFSFIEWNNSSIYYGFKEIEKDKLIVKEVHSNELKGLPIKRTDEVLDISTNEWFDLQNFDEALNIYLGKPDAYLSKEQSPKSKPNWLSRFFK